MEVKEQTLHKKMAVGSQSFAKYAIPYNVTVTSAISDLFMSRFNKSTFRNVRMKLLLYNLSVEQKKMDDFFSPQLCK
jgi:hypothetical protein